MGSLPQMFYGMSKFLRLATGIFFATFTILELLSFSHLEEEGMAGSSLSLISSHCKNLVVRGSTLLGLFVYSFARSGSSFHIPFSIFFLKVLVRSVL